MASASGNQTLDADLEPGFDLEEENLGKLESDVRQMAQKIAEYRKTLPDHLSSTLVSVRSSQTPVCPNIEPGSDPELSRRTLSETEEPVLSNHGSQLANEDQQSSEKMIQLKERVSKNFSAIPALVKRMQDCIHTIDNLDSLNETIHPAFKEKAADKV